MTRIDAAVEAARLPDAAADAEARRPHVGELAVMGSVLLLGVMSWVSLELAHLGRFRLLPAAVVTLGLVGIGGAVALRIHRPHPRVDRGELAMLAVVGFVAALMFFPGFPYGASDKDPGVYLEHGIAIARTGNYAIHDPALAPSVAPMVRLWSPGVRFPGIWIRDAKTQTIVPQFYHLYPAAIAAAYKAAGYGGVADLNPLFGMLAVMAFALALRRAVGPAAGWIGGVLLATNMLEVWGAKYPTTEIMTQAFFAAATLGIVIALQTGWRPAAGVAGALTGLMWTARPDGLLIVLIAVGVGAVLIALRRFDARCWWFAVGLAIVAPTALAQAYHYARTYTETEHLPTFRILVATIAGVLILALLVRALARPLGSLLTRLVEARVPQTVAGLGIAATAAVLLALGFLRSRLFGPTSTNYHGEIIRTFNELNLRRLSWFITLPGFALAGIGLAIAMLRRWRAALWSVILPFLLLFPLYAYDARISPRLMWWSRRYVSFNLIGLVALIAIAVEFAWTRRGTLKPVGRVAASAFAVFLLAVFLHQSLPLRGHRELGGSFAVAQRIAAAAAPQVGVFLWPEPQSCCQTATWLFGGAVWFQQGQVSIYTFPQPTEAYVASLARGFRGHPIFIVADGGARPSWMPEGSIELADHVTTTLRTWAEPIFRRPDAALQIPVDFSIWRVRNP